MRRKENCAVRKRSGKLTVIPVVGVGVGVGVEVGVGVGVVVGVVVVVADGWMDGWMDGMLGKCCLFGVSDLFSDLFLTCFQLELA